MSNPIIEKTVVILGAGASYDYKFPIGAKLTEDILNHEHKNFVLKENGTVREMIFNFETCEQIKNTLNISDDEVNNTSLDEEMMRNVQGSRFKFFKGFIAG